MRDAVDVVLRQSGGAAARVALLRVLTRNQLDDEVARGHLVAVFPRAYARPWDVDVPDIRRVAALASVGGLVGLSHVTALAVYGLPAPRDECVHVTTTVARHPHSGASDLVVHRTRIRTPLVQVGGMPTVPPDVAVVTSWPMLPISDRRGPMLAAVRDRLVTAGGLRDALAARPGLAGRTAQLRLVDLIEAGCESELELWGHSRVFTGGRFAGAVRQLSVPTVRGVFRLDLAFPDARVAVEMDGWRFHSGREQRERDMRRDAALAAAGWVVLRFSHQRLHADPDGCRRDVLTTLSARTRAA